MEQGEYITMDKIEQTHWWFVAKRGFLGWALGRTELNDFFSRRKTALDVGCGTGAVLQWLNTHGFEATGLDMSDLALNFCKEKKLVAIKGLADQLPCPDNSFDLVTALDVLEHLDDDKKAVKEIYRVLKPGGVCVVTVPAHQSLWSYHDVALHHKRRYTRKQIQAVLQTQFTDVQSTYIHTSILPLVWLVRKISGMSHSKHSDVKIASVAVNTVMRIVYSIEMVCLRIFGTLPFGTSVCVIAKKEVV